MRNRKASRPIAQESIPESVQDKHSAGATLIEYCFLAVLIFMVVVISLTFLGEEVNEGYSLVGSGFQQ